MLDQLTLNTWSKGRLPSQEFPQMLTDTFGGPAWNAGDTVVKVALVMLRLGDISSDLQRQPDYLWDLVAPFRGG